LPFKHLLINLKTWKEVVDQDMNDLHIKPSDAVDCSKWSK